MTKFRVVTPGDLDAASEPSPTERTLPHNLEAEKCVLGSVLIQNTTLDRVISLIKPEDFFRDAHQRIYRAMVDLAGHKQIIDFVTLKDALFRLGIIEEVGGPAYLASLTDGVPHSANVEAYAAMVADYAKLRRLIFAANRLTADAYDAEQDPHALVEWATHTFTDISGNGHLQGADLLPDVLTSLADHTRDPLVGDWIASGEITLLHGQPRDGKSWVALDCAVALATGTQALGIFPTSREVPTLIVGNEDGLAVVATRIARLVRGRGLETFPRQIGFLVHRGISLDRGDAQIELLREVKALGAGLLILDPLRSLSDRVDQGPAELRPVAAFLRRLVTETGVAVLIVHHDTKPKTGEPDTRRKAQRASGGGLFSIADNPLAVERVGSHKSLLTPDGFKHIADPQPFLVTRAGDPPDPVTLLAEATEVRSGEDLALQGRILEFLESSGGGSGRVIQKALAARGEDVNHQLDLLEKAGRVTFVIGKRRAKLWCLT